jgi:hypothetical protein
MAPLPRASSMTFCTAASAPGEPSVPTTMASMSAAYARSALACVGSLPCGRAARRRDGSELGRWNSLFGDAVLDLREARVSAPEVSIEAVSVFGNVELLVPEGVAVVIDSRAVFGDVEQEAGESAAPGAPRIVLRGGTVFGDVRVRSRRLRERLAERLADARRPRPPG